MYRDQDFDLERALPVNEAVLTQDLELNPLFNAMARGDKFLFDVAKQGVLASLRDPAAILYRQQVFRDCLDHPKIIREIYDLAVEAITGERRMYLSMLWATPDLILYRSVQMLEMYVERLKQLRKLADEQAWQFRSEGFTRFFAMLESELNDEYFQTIDSHLKELKFRHGVLISAGLGKGNKGKGYVLRRQREQSWSERLAFTNRSGYSFTIADRDEGGFKALEEIRGHGINLVANALAQSTDHIQNFFGMVRAELGFYLGCLNLNTRLLEKGEPTCFPVPLAQGNSKLTAQGLYDLNLTLLVAERVIGNDVAADDKTLVMITGANQGGKSTFLRSVGLAQLMMECGMLVAAETFSANVSSGIFTHFKREEDASMESGKLDEELSRMSEIADAITPNCLLLCNESFAATNEREGSEIARQVVRALIETGVKVFFVTHLYDLAHGFWNQHMESTLFLRAERQEDGRRTYKLVEGEPLPTSYGRDSYRRIFGVTPNAA